MSVIIVEQVHLTDGDSRIIAVIHQEQGSSPKSELERVIRIIDNLVNDGVPIYKSELWYYDSWRTTVNSDGLARRRLYPST